MSLLFGFASASRPPLQTLHPGKLVLEGLGTFFQDYSQLSGETGASVTAGNIGLSDLSPNDFNTTPVGNLFVKEVLNGSQLVTALGGSGYLDTLHDGSAWFKQSYEFYLLVHVTEGIPSSTVNLFGAIGSDLHQVWARISTAGKFIWQYRTSLNTLRYDSVNAIFTSGDNGVVLLRGKYDHGAQNIELWKNGVSVPLVKIGDGTVAGNDPANFNMARNVYINALNNNGTATLNSEEYNFIRVAFTPLLTSQQSNNVSEYMLTFDSEVVTRPSLQSTEITASFGQTTVDLSCVPGNGLNRIWIGRQGSAVGGFTLQDGVSYTGNLAFGSGQDLGGGNFVLSTSSDNTITVTGLTRDLDYYFDVYEYNETGLLYLQTVVVNSNSISGRTTYITDNDFANYGTDYTENVVNGFTSTVSNGELILDGEPLGFQDWVSHNDWKETLEEFEIEIGVRINGTPNTGTPGIGIGIKNDVDNEANRGVVCLFVTDTDAGNFGRVQIYAGNGSVNPNGYTFRTQSSGAFAPALNSQYKIVIKRQVLGNDAQYTATVTDMLDPNQNSIISSPFIETGRPSSAFFATTMRSWIYQNGGDHAIDYFIVRRIGDASPPPEVEEFDVYVTTSGDDDNDGLTPATAKRTIVAGLNAIQALGGAVGSKKLSIGPGTYVEAQMVPPSNLGLMQGATRNTTLVAGASSMYLSTTVTNPSRSGDAGALIFFNNLGNVSTKIASMTFLGNKDIGGLTNSVRHCFVINNTHGVVLEDIAIRFFNTTGLKLGNVNDFRMEDFFVESSAGEASSFTFYEIQTYNIGSTTLLETGRITDFSDSNYRIIFKNGTIDGRKSIHDGDAWSDGGGWGIVGGGGNDRYINNVKWENVTFLINKKGIAQHSGVRFPIEGLYMAPGNLLIKDCYFEYEVSWGGLTDIDHTTGHTRMTGCTWNLDPDTAISATLVIEMQISNFEIDHCYIRKARNGVFSSINDQDTFGNAAHAEITRGNHGNWWIHHNIIELWTASNYGMFGGRAWSLENINIYNNTIIFTTTQSVTSNPNWYAIFTDNDSDGGTNGLVYENNAFLNAPPNPSQFWDGGNISNGIHRNNFAGRIGSSGTPFGVTATRSGVASSGNQVLSSGSNTLILALGTVPITRDEAFNGNYYRPASNSPLKGAGHDGSDVGALTAL